MSTATATTAVTTTATTSSTMPATRRHRLLSSPANAVRTLRDLAEVVAEDGIAAHHDEVVGAVTAAGLAARFPVLAAIAVDAASPPVARERALGRLAAVAGTPTLPVRSAPTTVWAPAA